MGWKLPSIVELSSKRLTPPRTVRAFGLHGQTKSVLTKQRAREVWRHLLSQGFRRVN